MVPSGSSRRTSMRESVGSPAKEERERSRAAVVVAVLRLKSRRPIIYFLSSLGEPAHAGRTYDIQFWTARKRFRWSNFEKQGGQHEVNVATAVSEISRNVRADCCGSDGDALGRLGAS